LKRNGPKPLPPVERLRELFVYDAETGVITWRVDRLGANGRCVVRAGSVAGGLVSGYRVLNVDGVYFKAHRVAGKMVYGEEPPAEIDHKNKHSADNRIKNLRVATHRQNTANGPLRKNNRSGVTGVFKSGRTQKWHVTIQRDGRSICVGEFADFDEAVTARVKAAAETYGAFTPHSTPAQEAA
jgi:hypothetical protein